MFPATTRQRGPVQHPSDSNRRRARVTSPGRQELRRLRDQRANSSATRDNTTNPLKASHTWNSHLHEQSFSRLGYVLTFQSQPCPVPLSSTASRPISLVETWPRAVTLRTKPPGNQKQSLLNTPRTLPLHRAFNSDVSLYSVLTWTTSASGQTIPRPTSEPSFNESSIGTALFLHFYEYDIVDLYHL